VRLSGKTVEGGCRASLPLLEPMPDAEYDVWLEADLRDGTLSGTVSAYTPAPLYRFLLPAYVRLSRVDLLTSSRTAAAPP
jgi:hypothetical protein